MPSKPKSEKKRLDVLVVERGLAESREKAQAMILAVEVRINGTRGDKAGMPVSADARIEIFARRRRSFLPVKWQQTKRSSPIGTG